jgi:predicted phosphodiesterase
MRVAALYDIHGNLPALEAALDGVAKSDVDEIVVGGDVFPGPMPRETLAVLRDLNLPVQFIHGNGDREVLARLSGVETDWYRNARAEWRDPIDWTASQLTMDDQQFLSVWPATIRLTIPPVGGVLFCHATPANDVDIFTRLTPEERVASIFEGINDALVVCGHTHMQFDRQIAGVRVVNAGSVGMPFGRIGAHWILIDGDAHFRCTQLDVISAADRIRATRYPGADDFAIRYLLNPVSEEEMLKVFEG